jgi:hypothetical protein
MSLWQFAKQQLIKRSPALAAKIGGLSVADGPLPIGELIALGVTAWEVKQIYDDYQAHVLQSRKKEPKKEGELEKPQENEGKQRHGGGKNAQHGKAEAPPKLVKDLAEAEAQLAELKRTQGPKKEKKKLEIKIENLKKEIGKAMKGENHSQKPKGPQR